MHTLVVCIRIRNENQPNKRPSVALRSCEKEKETEPIHK